VDEDPGYPREMTHALQQRGIAEAVVAPVVGDQASEGVAEVRVLPAGVPVQSAGADGHVGVLPQRPLLGGRIPEDRVIGLEQTGIRIDDPVVSPPEADIGLLGEGREAVPGLREDRAHALGDPVDLSPAGGGDAEQHDPTNPVRMRLRIGESQGGAPGDAVQDPGVHAEVFSQGLHVRDEVRRGVGLEGDLRVRCVGEGATATALLEADDPRPLQLETVAVPRGAERPARSAVHVEGGGAVRIAPFLPIDLLAIADGEHAVVAGRRGKGRRGAHRCVPTLITWPLESR
jgi:hypothetical protein